MKRTIPITLCLAIFGLSGLAQSNSHRTRRARVMAKVVTVTGCVRQGVECLVLEPIGGGQKYSIARSSKLVTGRAYRITGRTSEVGFCMEGMPILSPQRIFPLKVRCPRTSVSVLPWKGDSRCRMNSNG